MRIRMLRRSGLQCGSIITRPRSRYNGNTVFPGTVYSMIKIKKIVRPSYVGNDNTYIDHTTYFNWNEFLHSPIGPKGTYQSWLNKICLSQSLIFEICSLLYHRGRVASESKIQLDSTNINDQISHLSMTITSVIIYSLGNVSLIYRVEQKDT